MTPFFSNISTHLQSFSFCNEQLYNCTTVPRLCVIGENEIISKKRTTQGYPSNICNWYNRFGFNSDRFTKTFNNHCQITQVWVGYMHAIVSEIFVSHEIAQRCCRNSWSLFLYTVTAFFFNSNFEGELIDNFEWSFQGRTTLFQHPNIYDIVTINYFWCPAYWFFFILQRQKQVARLNYTLLCADV